MYNRTNHQKKAGNDMSRQFRIFVINPGSTSTKVSLFLDETCQFSSDVFHDSAMLRKYPTINDQLDFRMEVIEKFLKDNRIDLTGIDAIVGRGGSCCSVRSGIYAINDLLIKDTREAKGGLYHSSMLGVQLAKEFQKRYGGIMLMMDPPVVDELCDLARMTGVKGIYRRAVSHALNLKATAKHHAETIGKRYEDCNFIVCHIDGGISITAHCRGRMIDGNDAGGGEGPYTPTRMGSMAVTDIARHLPDCTAQRLKDLCSQAGGFSSWFNTSDSNRIYAMAEAGDAQAARVWDGMIYQVIKYIGAMSTVLKGDVDGIVLTGGLLRFPDVEQKIRESCGWIAPVTSYPGEFEQEAMAAGALAVLRHEVTPAVYTGTPVWNGFPDQHPETGHE